MAAAFALTPVGGFGVVDTKYPGRGRRLFPGRLGSLPTGQLVSLCFSGKSTAGEVRKMLAGHGGLVATPAPTTCVIC